MSDSVQKYSASRMGSAPIGPLLLSCSVPMMISMLVQALYNIVDSIFVSRVNEAALSAVSLAFPIQNLMIAFAVGTAVGVNAYLSRCLGEGNRAEASRAAMNGLFLAFCGGIAFLVFGILGARAFIASQTTDAQIMQYGADYLSICTLWCMGLFLQCMLEKLLVATGRSAFAMTSQLIGALVNIALDPIFIFALDMGVRGAALATVLAQGCSALWVLKFLTGSKTKWHLRREHLRPQAKVVLPALALGASPFIMQSTESLITVCFNSSLLKYGGDIAVGAMTVLSSIMQFAMMPLQGLTQGAQPIISYNYGARNPERVRRAFQVLLMACLAYSLLLWALVQLFPQLFALMFTSDSELVSYASWALRIYMAATGIFGIQIACQMTFVSIGAAGCSIIVAVLRKFVLLLPLIYLMPRLLADQTMAVYTAEPVADAIAVTCTAILFTVQFRKALRKLDAED